MSDLTIDGERSSECLNPVGQATQTGSTTWVGSAPAIVGDEDCHFAIGHGEFNSDLSRLSMLGDVGNRFRANEVDRPLDGGREPNSGHFEASR